MGPENGMQMSFRACAKRARNTKRRRKPVGGLKKQVTAREGQSEWTRDTECVMFARFRKWNYSRRKDARGEVDDEEVATVASCATQVSSEDESAELDKAEVERGDASRITLQLETQVSFQKLNARQKTVYKYVNLRDSIAYAQPINIETELAKMRWVEFG